LGINAGISAGTLGLEVNVLMGGEWEGNGEMVTW
jgi:hypothetical protein